MKIHWHQNPFKTRIELDDRDRKMVLLALQCEEYEQILISLDMKLKDKEKPLTDLDEIKKRVGHWGEICNMEVDSESVQRYLSYIDDEHMGDCTCVPCSCMRCYLENMLGIDTIRGLGKHAARNVQSAFGVDGDRTIEAAIATLEEPKEYVKGDSWARFSQEEYEKHIPRWESERKAAAVWLRNYKQEHGF
jgi:hypothetical protein